MNYQDWFKLPIHDIGKYNYKDTTMDYFYLADQIFEVRTRVPWNMFAKTTESTTITNINLPTSDLKINWLLEKFNGSLCDYYNENGYGTPFFDRQPDDEPYGSLKRAYEFFREYSKLFA